MDKWLKLTREKIEESVGTKKPAPSIIFSQNSNRLICKSSGYRIWTDIKDQWRLMEEMDNLSKKK